MRLCGPLIAKHLTHCPTLCTNLLGLRHLRPHAGECANAWKALRRRCHTMQVLCRLLTASQHRCQWRCTHTSFDLPMPVAA